MAKENTSLATCMAELDEQGTMDLVKARIERSDDAGAMLLECRKGLDEIGRKYDVGEYFIADLVYAASIFKGVMDILGPELRKSTAADRREEKVAIATVKDDIHDIGKNLVASMLDAAGFEVIDLGVDVPADNICDCIREQKPDIVALSCLLTTTVDSMESIIAAVSRAGLRDGVRIIVGGIPLTPGIAASIGADTYGDSATQAVVRCRELMENVAR